MLMGGPESRRRRYVQAQTAFFGLDRGRHDRRGGHGLLAIARHSEPGTPPAAFDGSAPRARLRRPHGNCGLARPAPRADLGGRRKPHARLHRSVAIGEEFRSSVRRGVDEQPSSGEQHERVVIFRRLQVVEPDPFDVPELASVQRTKQLLESDELAAPDDFEHFEPFLEPSKPDADLHAERQFPQEFEQFHVFQ